MAKNMKEDHLEEYIYTHIYSSDMQFQGFCCFLLGKSPSGNEWSDSWGMYYTPEICDSTLSLYHAHFNQSASEGP